MLMYRPIMLYKVHEDPDCEELLNITRYLYYKNIDLRPINVQEKLFPSNVFILPTIIYNKIQVSGVENIVYLYQKLTGMGNLRQKAHKFVELNPNYRIMDKSTHKNLQDV